MPRVDGRNPHTATADGHHGGHVEVNGVRLMAISTRLVVILQLSDVVAVVRDGYLNGARARPSRT
jgi:hypothetical protein